MSQWRYPILSCGDVQRLHPDVDHCGSCWAEQENGEQFGPEDWPPAKDGRGWTPTLEHPCAQTCCGCTRLVQKWTRDEWAHALRLRRKAEREKEKSTA